MLPICLLAMWVALILGARNIREKEDDYSSRDQ